MPYTEFTGQLDAPKGGYMPFTGTLDPVENRAPLQSLGDPGGSGFAEMAAQPTREAGAGRGFVNPSPDDAKRDVGAAESFGRGWGKAGATSAKALNLAVAAPVVVFESIKNSLFGSKDTSATDAVFRNLVDPTQEAVNWYSLKPDEKQGFLAKVADGLGGLAQDLPVMIASGGTAAETKLAQAFPTIREFLGNAVGRGFDAMRPLMVKSGTEKAEQVLEAGGSVEQAVNSAATAAMLTGFIGSQPMSATGSALSRVLTGIPVGAVTSEGHRAIQNAADPEALNQPFSLENAAVGAITNAAMAGAMGHKAPAAHADRIDLGYDPLTGKTATAEAVQGMGEPIARATEPGRAEPARPADILKATTVDEAIATAQKAVDSAQGLDETLTSIRPLNGKIGNAEKSRDGSSVVQDVARDEGSLPQSESEVLPALRSPGGSGLPGMAGEFPAVFGGHGPASDSGALARPLPGQGRGLPAGERPVGDGERTESQQANESANRVSGANEAAGRVGRDIPAGRDDTNLPPSLELARPKGAGNEAASTAAGRETGGADPSERRVSDSGAVGGKGGSQILHASAPDMARDAAGRGADNAKAKLGAAQVADAVEPAKTWFGRAGDGYKTEGDAAMALPSRRLKEPGLAWQIEPMPSGKFRLAGYAQEGAKSGDAENTSPPPEIPIFAATKDGGSGDGRADAQRIRAVPSEDAGAESTGASPRDLQASRATADHAPAQEQPGPARSEVAHETARPETQSPEVRQARVDLPNGGSDAVAVAGRADRAQAGTPAPDGVRAAERVPAENATSVEVSRYTGKYGKGMGHDAARLEASRLNREAAKADSGITYTAEEHGDAKLENPWAVVGRKAGTTEAVTTPKDVVGESQGGRSADDKTTGAAHPLDEWIKGSKAVDARGQPRVMYHGSTTAGLDSIQPGTKEPGAWFTAEFQSANDYAKSQDGQIYEAYLNIKKPLLVRFEDQRGKLIPLVDGKPIDIDNNVDIVKYAMKNGYDGVHFPDGNFSEDGEAWVAFRSDQIRLIPNESSAPNRDGAKPAEPPPAVPKLGAEAKVAPEPAKGGKPRLAESADSLWSSIREMQGGVVHDGRIIVPTLQVIVGDQFKIGPSGALEVVDRKNGGMGVRDATNAEADEFHRDLTADRVQVQLMSPPGYGSGNKAQRVLQVLHSPSGNDFRGKTEAAKPAEPIPDATRAESILDAAGIKGAERISALKDVKSGAITVDELARAHPASEAEKPPSGKTGEGSDTAMAAMVEKRGEHPYEGDGTIDLNAGLNPKESIKAVAKALGISPGSGAHHEGLLSHLIDSAINPVSEGLDTLGNKSGAYSLLAPMSGGTQQSRAMAQAHINASRKAGYTWNLIDRELTSKYPMADRRLMYDAADEENDLRRAGIDSKGTGKGLDRLNAKQRATMDTLHAYADDLWDRAKAVGMVTGEGVDYWTPRMMVKIGEAGDYAKPSEGKQGTSDGVGRNLTTTASSLKNRKYELSADTEAAMKAKGGELVRDIRTMPLAMAKLEKAIAGRELVNQIKDLGQATGKKLVSDTADEGFFTLNHPAFKTYGPRMKDVAVTPEELAARDYYIDNGKVMRRVADASAPALERGEPLKSYTVHADGSVTQERAALDAEGNPIMDAKELHISNDFKGPLKAILSQGLTQNEMYQGYMLLKSKSMSTIMYSPLVHNQVILGRALAYGGFKTPLLYFTGNVAKNDTKFMQMMIGGGMVPIGAHNNMLDVGDIASDVAGTAKPGSWRDPNESWIGLGAQKAGNAIYDGLGTKIKEGFDPGIDVKIPFTNKTFHPKFGIDPLGDLWHNKFLWDRVADLQAGIAKDVYDKLTAKGLDQNAAVTVAAHIANRYAGAIGKENMSELAHIAANITLFSKSFNMGNVGTVKDAFYGLPAGLKAQLMENSKAEDAIKALDFAKHKARIGLVRDLAFSIVVSSLVQDWFNSDKAKSIGENISAGLEGYQKRAAEAWANANDNPLKLTSYNPQRLSSTWANEPDKRDRIHTGDDESGRGQYMRLPTGKVVEDLYGWIMHPWDTADKKKSPFMSALERTRNIKDKYDTPVWDPGAAGFKGLAQSAVDLAKAIVGTQIPLDDMQRAMDIARGKGTEADKEKLKGTMTGLTVSQGHPQGPEGAVAAKVEERVNASKKYSMDAVKRDLKYGDEDAARDKLEAIGLSEKEITRLINRVQEPKSGLSKAARSRFNRHADESERQLMDQQR